MGVTTVWDDNDHTIVRMIFTGHWSLAEFQSANTQAALMVRSIAPLSGYVITDMAASEHVPAGIIWKLRELLGMRPPNWGGGIIVSDSALVMGLVDVFGKVYMPVEGRLFFVRTNAEALETIAALKQKHRGE